MKKVLFIICISGFLSACNDKRQENTTGSEPGYPVRIALAEACKNPKTITLADIADSIVYIPLETKKEYPLTEVHYTAFMDKDIFVYAGNKTGLLRYDHKGRFLNKAGTIGKGQQEYLPGSEFAITDKPERIFILSKFEPRRILEIDFNGYYIDRFLITSLNDGGFEVLPGERFLMLAGNASKGLTNTPEYLACIRNKNNLTIDAVAHPFSRIGNDGESNRFTSHGGAVSGKYFNGYPLFFDANSVDTIYSVGTKGIYPRYIIDKGSEAAPSEVNYSAERLAERYNYLYPIAASISETPHDFHIIFINENHSYLATWSKSTNTITSMAAPFDPSGRENSRPPTFRNDIDGGVSVVPGKPNRKGDVWTYFLPAKYLKSVLTDDHFIRSQALQPEKREALKKLVQSLDADDNPVVMAVYLKK